MTNLWYAEVPPETEITQGDLIMGCPVLEWSKPAADYTPESLKAICNGISADIVVMTQACDLAQKKVDNVIVCAHYSLSEYKTNWEETKKTKGQAANPKEWKNLCNDICDGYRWHLSMLNGKDDGDLKIERRIVDFHYIYSLPIEFLQSFVKSQNTARLTLLPPYREHLSQAFARFFMRVGLPINIPKSWD